MRSNNKNKARALLPSLQNSNYDFGIVYARLSDTRNPNEISIERQIDNGHLFFKKHGIPHNCKTDHFTEPKGHRSGWSEKQRPAYRRMREVVSKREGKGMVWCQAQERFTRAEDATTVIRHWIEDLHVDLVFDAELVSLATFNEWMQVHTRSYIHAMESRLGSERMNRYYKKFYDNGAEHRRHPVFGLKIVGSGKDRHNEANPETLPMVVKFLEMYARGNVGTGTRGVRLAREAEVRFQTKQHQWRKAVTVDLSTLIRNLEAYKDFLPASLYQRCLRVREQRRRHKKNSRPMTHEPVLLRGIATCARCKCKLRQLSREQLRHHSYRHPNQKGECAFDGRYLSARPIDEQAVQKLRTLAQISDDNKRRIIKVLTTQPPDTEQERRHNEIQSLRNARERLMDGWLLAGLAPEEFNRKRAEIDARLEELQEEPEPQVVMMDAGEAERLFEDLPQRIERAREFPAEGNALAQTWLGSAEIDFATGRVRCKFRWE